MAGRRANLGGSVPHIGDRDLRARAEPDKKNAGCGDLAMGVNRQGLQGLA